MSSAVRNTIISAVVILIVLIGGGLAYTYFFGPSAEDAPAVVTPPPAATPKPLGQPSKPDPNAKVGASVQSLTSPVAQGENASITVRTTPTAKCVISVVYDNVASKDSGLTSKVADEYGIATWTWTVEKTVPAGKWPVKVTCEFNNKSAVVQTDLTVQTAIAPQQ